MLPKRALKTFLKDPSNCCVETKTRAGGSWRAEPGWGNKLGKRHRGMEHRQDGRSGGGRFHDLFSSWSPKDVCRERERGVKCDAKVFACTEVPFSERELAIEGADWGGRGDRNPYFRS